MLDSTIFMLTVVFLCCGVLLFIYIICCNYCRKLGTRLPLRCCTLFSSKNKDSSEKEAGLPNYDELEDCPPSYEEAMKTQKINSFQECVIHFLHRFVNFNRKDTQEMISCQDP